MRTVTGFEQRSDGTWRVDTIVTGRWLRRKKKSFTASYLALAAGTYNTQKLLFKMRDKGKLPKISDKLGMLTRTNSESIVGAGRFKVTPDLDLTHGVAITSSIHPTPDTHIEPVRYGKGSNAMGLLQTLMTDGAGPQGTDVPRWNSSSRRRQGSARNAPDAQRPALERTHDHRAGDAAPGQLHHDVHQADETWLPRMTSKQGHGEPNPTWIPVGQRSDPPARGKIDGVAGGTWGELFNIPLTAHFLGGAAIGDSPESGVIDPYQRVYGYPTLSVVDGAAVSANLGVNPSLSITAQAERAASLWPNKGEADLRPGEGEASGASIRSRRSIPSCLPMPPAP